MKRRLCTISLLALMGAAVMAATPADADTLARPTNRYDRYLEHYRNYWAALIPTQFIIQNAGNMGVVSAGIGWDYGHDRWETHLLFGYIPRHKSSRGKLTTTLKENYIPFSFALRGGWSVEPLTASIYLNTVYGHEFWPKQPARYPDKYYEFMSTKMRLNVALGQHFTLEIPQEKRRDHRSISLYYEVGTCDLYLRSKFLDHSVKWRDILGLSLGIKIQRL